ncbi:type IV pilus modification PilV family protein [Ferdinandcohnia quinoae]|uniref:Type II secretion system GspH family protein n=1 Tax=Fredinandcohnia quinoae TaxID=2918902 RepID=A0AAW5EAX0_9BACI|nr:type II secretion system protein [Fredinandcohnia sp. SECRCQ15]MCH1626576.1 type II secretion system GspH family protein [Fredinandcohnia sp. SECRCQ15]
MNISLKNITSQKGITLVEILASIVILTIIIFTFLSMYIHSAKTNKISKDILDATYVAQSQIESIYNISNNTNLIDGLSALHTNLGFKSNGADCNTGCEFDKQENGYYILLSISGESNDLYKVIINVFNNPSMEQKEAQIETLLSWKKAEVESNDTE